MRDMGENGYKKGVHKSNHVHKSVKLGFEQGEGDPVQKGRYMIPVSQNPDVASQKGQTVLVFEGKHVIRIKRRFE